MFEQKLRTLGLFSLEKGKAEGNERLWRVQGLTLFLRSAWWKHKRQCTQVAGKEIPTRFRKKVVYGQSS